MKIAIVPVSVSDNGMLDFLGEISVVHKCFKKATGH